MLNITKDGNSVRVEGTGNKYFPDDGCLSVPVNNIIIVLDESDFVTFRSAASNNVYFSANINQIRVEGLPVTKNNIITVCDTIFNTSQGGGGGEQVQANWNETDPSSKAYIRNKPTNVSAFANDAGYLTQHQSLADYSTTQEMNTAIATATNDMATMTWVGEQGYLTQHQDISDLFNGAEYDTQTKRINFKHGNTVLAYIDATTFIKDGMVDSVVISNGNLVITFNTDAGKEPIIIPLTDIFNPNNYYTKSATDTLLSAKADTSALSNVAFSGDYDDLTNKPTIPTVPTNVSAFTNDAGYTTNTGTITGITMNGASKGTSGVVDLGTVITDISSKQDVIDSSHKLDADLVDDTTSTNKFVTASDKSTWSGKQDELVSGTNIKTINNESILGSGNITIQGGGGTTYTAGDGIDITSDVITNTREQRVLIYDDTITGVKAALQVVSPHWGYTAQSVGTTVETDVATDLTFVNNVPAANADPYVQANYLDGTLMEFEITDYSVDSSSSFAFDPSQVSGGEMYGYNPSTGEWVDEMIGGAIYQPTDFAVGEKFRMNSTLLSALVAAMQTDKPYNEMTVEFKVYAWSSTHSVSAIHSGTVYPLTYNSDLATVATSGAYSDLSGAPYYIAGTNMSIDSSGDTDTINCTLPIKAGTHSTAKGIIVGDSECTSTGQYNISLGHNADNSGSYSLCIGSNSSIGANGSLSIVLGSKIVCNGSQSFVGGVHGNSYPFNKNHTFSFGQYLHNYCTGETSFGKYNASRVDDDYSFGLSGNTLFTVGNGYDFSSTHNPHNAFEIRQNGDIYIPNTNDTTDQSSTAYSTYPMVRLQTYLATVDSLVSRVTALETSVGNISSSLDTINGEVI